MSGTPKRRLTAVLVVAFFVLGGLLLLVREVFVPRVAEFRPQVAAALERAIGLPVSIERLSADWQGWRLRLHLGGLTVHERSGAAALHLETVDATLAWSSLWRARAHFHRLVLVAPELALRRDADGQLFVAGVRIDPQHGRGGFLEWLLVQREIVIVDAVLSWADHLRGAPPLRLEALAFRLSNVGARHRFGLRARPPPALAALLDVRGDLVSGYAGGPGGWSGQLYAAVHDADLGGWQAWVDYPVPLAGFGAARAWMDVRAGDVAALLADVALAEVTAQLGDGLPELRLDSVRGRLGVRRLSGRHEFSAHGLELVAGEALHMARTDLELVVHDRDDPGGRRGSLRANRLDVAVLAGLAAHLPLDEAIRGPLDAFAPHGRLEDLRVAWQGRPGELSAWEVHTRFADVALNAHGTVPGVAGLSGELSGDQERGRFRIAGADALLDLPAVFPEARLTFSSLQAEGGWRRRDGRMEIVLDGLRFDNPDAAGSASGRYLPVAGGRGEIDLAARLTRADGESVWRYLPWAVNEATRSWLRRALVGGSVPEARLRLKGDLQDFPFDRGQSGQFLVTARVAGAKLHYADGWPAIEAIDGELRFEGAGMRIAADSARLSGVLLSDVVADVPDLDAPDGPVMTVQGRASGASADFLRFIDASPVRARIGTFTDGLSAEGRGTLELTLVMPLRDIDRTRVDGEFRFAGNRVSVLEGLPPLVDARARVRFTEDSLTIRDGAARALGEPLRLSARTPQPGHVSFRVEGGATMRALRETYDWPVLAHLSGTTAWSADIDVQPLATRVRVASTLAGISSSLPAPFNKRAAERWPLEVQVDFGERGAREHVRGGIAGRLAFELARRRTAAGWQIERGGVGVFAPAALMERGLMLSAQLDEFDVDAWRRVLGGTTGERPALGGTVLGGIDVRARRVTAFGRSFPGFELGAIADDGGWKGRLASEAAAGTFDWRSAGQGALHARLDRLAIGGADEPSHALEEALADEPPRDLPALDVVAERFALHGRELGRLELRAVNQAGGWMLDALALQNPEGRFKATGQWRPGREQRTEIEFDLQTGDIGALLARIGHPQAVRGGNATLAGRLAWQGVPTRIDYPTLGGHVDVQARAGQFRQLEPGVGRLLGVLSLQALPRRLTLDFRDVFSEGFAFDSISGSISMAAGVMRTDDLHIAGPAARIWIGGSADVARETQDLRVIVQPTLSESVAVGAAAGLINPVAGVLAYIAQKMLSDPIERMFAYTYAITGTWADPKVEKLAGGAAPGDGRSQGEQRSD